MVNESAMNRFMRYNDPQNELRENMQRVRLTPTRKSHPVFESFRGHVPDMQPQLQLQLGPRKVGGKHEDGGSREAGNNEQFWGPKTSSFW